MSSSLSREEITALIASIKGEPFVETDMSSSVKSSAAALDLTANQERIFRGRLPGLEIIFERFAVQAKNRLTRMLDRNVHLGITRLDTEKFGGFLKKLSFPSSLHLFRVLPLPSQGILVYSTSLVFTLIDHLMGGKGKRQLQAQGREFSPLEIRLIGKVTGELLQELEIAWKRLVEVECRYVQGEFNPLAISIVPATDRVVVINLELTIEETTGTLSYCLPYQLLQPIKDKLSSNTQSLGTNAYEINGSRLASHLFATHCDIQAVLAEGTMKARDVLSLTSGDIISLETPADSPAKILVQGKEKFKGQVGTSRGQRSVRIL